LIQLEKQILKKATPCAMSCNKAEATPIPGNCSTTTVKSSRLSNEMNFPFDLQQAAVTHISLHFAHHGVFAMW